MYLKLITRSFSDTGVVQKRRRTYSDSDFKAETEYLRTARKGGGHKGMQLSEF